MNLQMAGIDFVRAFYEVPRLWRLLSLLFMGKYTRMEFQLMHRDDYVQMRHDYGLEHCDYHGELKSIFELSDGIIDIEE